MELKEKTVLVTGASSGIGRAVAIACAQKGAIVLIHYRKNKKGAEETLSEVEKYSRGKIFVADLADPKQIKGMFESFVDSVGPIDLLVNNAGDSQPGDFLNDEMWEFEFQNVFFPTLRVSQYFLKQKINISLRKILNITSCYGLLEGGSIEYFSYSVAKAAIASMTVTLAKVDSKVLVNAIAPGYTWTPPWEDISPQGKEFRESQTMIKRFIKSEEIGHLAVALLENDAITGQIVTVDGGLSL